MLVFRNTQKSTLGSTLSSREHFSSKNIPSAQAKRSGFTMMELIFVIVIIGLLSKYGVEFMAQAYKGFIFSKINNNLQNKSATAVEFISKRLSYRIKDSVIARKTDGSFTSIQNASGDTYNILEWVGSDIDNFRGDALPNWSAIIDLDAGDATSLHSPDTNTTALNNFINILSNGNTGLADSAIYFIGSNSDVNSSYGWNGSALTSQQNAAMHPITYGTTPNDFSSNIGGVDFSGVDIYEYYKLAWTAYAIELEPIDGNLTLYYDYQPWNGESYTDNGVKSSLIMQNVDTFQFRSIGSLIKIQVCVNSPLTNQEYSICKEKTIY